MKIWKYEISEILIALLCVLVLINLSLFVGFGIDGIVFGSLVSFPMVTLIILLNSAFVLIEKVEVK